MMVALSVAIGAVIIGVVWGIVNSYKNAPTPQYAEGQAGQNFTPGAIGQGHYHDGGGGGGSIGGRA